MIDNVYDKMPVIQTPRFILRDIKKSDYKDLFEYGSDPEVVHYLSWGPMQKESEAIWAIENVFLARLKRKVPVGYAIEWRTNRKMIGTIDFHSVRHSDECAEIGYVIHRDYWNMGITTDALKEMIKIGFEYLNLKRIEIRHMRESKASEKVIRRCDFRLEGIARKAYYSDRTHQFHDVLQYSILREEYDKGELSWQ